MSTTIDIETLRDKAYLFRQEILNLTNKAGCGHPGGSLSAVEIMIALYENQLKHDPKKPDWDDRDRLIVSKGHVTPVVYTTLANYGYFSKNEYNQYRRFGSILQGHVHTKVPGVEFNTGSLGHGLSVANGMAFGAKLRGKNIKTYCLMGDGEIQEGSVWEAAMTAAHHKIGNVCAIIDYNKVQENGPTEDIKDLEPLVDKWKNFGWEVADIDGHNLEDLFKAFEQFNNSDPEKPFVIIANTIKGKGVQFMEGDRNWHGKAPNDEKLKEALEILERV